VFKDIEKPFFPRIKKGGEDKRRLGVVRGEGHKMETFEGFLMLTAESMMNVCLKVQHKCVNLGKNAKET
jgi:hypothetical protein